MEIALRVKKHVKNVCKKRKMHRRNGSKENYMVVSQALDRCLSPLFLLWQLKMFFIYFQSKDKLRDSTDTDSNHYLEIRTSPSSTIPPQEWGPQLTGYYISDQEIAITLTIHIKHVHTMQVFFTTQAVTETFVLFTNKTVYLIF